MNNASVEDKTQEIGREIFSKLKGHEPAVWESLWWERETVKWLAGDNDIKSRMLRFIDVFPALKTDRDIARHIHEYMPEDSLRLPPELRLGEAVVSTALLTPATAAMATKLAVGKVAKWFIAGDDVEETSKTISELKSQGYEYTLDFLGEATLSDKEADKYMERYVDIIERLAKGRAEDDPGINVSLKLSSLVPKFNPLAQEHSIAEAQKRITPILKSAMKHDAKVTIDMEDYQIHDLTLEFFKRILQADEFSGWDGMGIVIQTYLESSEQALDELLCWARDKNKSMSIRLVKGAYWEQEVVMAGQKRWPVPVRRVKSETDAAYERMTEKLLENSDLVFTAIGSHNIRSISKALALAGEFNIPKDRLEVQMLYGMADEVKRALVDMGVPVRIYTPFGNPLPGMAYLVRRILENSSNESFLRRSFVEDKPLDELMGDPAELTGGDEKNKTPGHFVYEREGELEFVNEPDTMFHDRQERDAMDAAIEQMLNETGQHYTCLVNGVRIDTDSSIQSIDPAEPSRLVGTVAEADEDLAVRAMDAASTAFEEWSRMDPEKRAEILIRAGDIVRERKFELAAWEMLEAGKTRREAVADVDEAIDHINFYAVSGVEVSRPVHTQKILGETNMTRTIPRGPGVVISPWNFPLAILAGLSVSALAAGNTVVIKPSSLSPVTAALFTDILHEAGLPEGAANFVAGSGHILGPALIEHPATTFASFTGSWEVGADIVSRAAAASKDRDAFIKVVAEMGGKNAIIVDKSADLDDAVTGVLASAFGFGGQKCSACSRVIVLDDVYDDFTVRLIAAAESLIVGSPLNPETDYGPLIDNLAVEKTARYVNIGTKESKTLMVGAVKPLQGFFAAPSIFGDVPPDSALAMDEVFGPVLSVIRAQTVEQGFKIANNCHYALTGGVYSRTPSTVQKAVEKMRVGNLYVNRNITGAIVERQPFGGFKRSGLGSAKAGSRDLIRELGVPQSVTENIVRHGFSPDVG